MHCKNQFRYPLQIITTKVNIKYLETTVCNVDPLLLILALSANK